MSPSDMAILFALIIIAVFDVAVWLWGVDSREAGHNPATQQPTQRKV
jgi:hypothetical protein